VVVERKNDPLTRALIQSTQTYGKKLEDKQNQKRNSPIFDTLDEETKNFILNGELVQNEAIISTLEDPAEDDHKARRMTEIIKKKNGE